MTSLYSSLFLTNTDRLEVCNLKLLILASPRTDFNKAIDTYLDSSAPATSAEIKKGEFAKTSLLQQHTNNINKTPTKNGTKTLSQ